MDKMRDITKHRGLTFDPLWPGWFIDVPGGKIWWRATPTRRRVNAAAKRQKRARAKALRIARMTAPVAKIFKEAYSPFVSLLFEADPGLASVSQRG